MAHEAVFSIDIDAPVQAVWDEITKTGEAQPAYYGTVLHSTLEPGASMEYQSADGSVPVKGTVLEIDPPRRFSHTFLFAHLDDPASVATWELKANESGGTSVTIVHSELAEDSQTSRDVAQGWPHILGALKAQLEGTPAQR